MIGIFLLGVVCGVVLMFGLLAAFAEPSVDRKEKA